MHEMETGQAPCENGEEDYIDMEVSSSSNFFCYSISSPPQSREFEFQMCSLSRDGEPTTSPADELFYKGKLLPLHLPPRLQMVQQLLQKSSTAFDDKAGESETFEGNFQIPFITVSTSTTTSTNISTPLVSCTISPSESCRVSSELNPDEYFFEWSTEMSSFTGDHLKKSWTRKLKQIKQSSLCHKFKASRAYLKSLFSRSGCLDESSTKATCNLEPQNVSKGKVCLSKYMKVPKKNPFGYIDNSNYKISVTALKGFDREMVEDGSAKSYRRSFSGAIPASKSSSSSTSTSSSGSSSLSSSFSFSLNGLYDLPLLKRSSSANSEIESSIEGAIAHCKQSHQMFSSRKALTEVGDFSLSASTIAAFGNKERPGTSRI